MASFRAYRQRGAPRQYVVWGVRCACAMLGMLGLGGAFAQPVSPAETLLFETAHLQALTPPATLIYDFRKLSNVEPPFSDKVQLTLAAIKGKRNAVLHFLSGERKRDIPVVDDVHGNPVLLGFLERDIAEMQRLTGGSAMYFRKRIRMALATGARVTAQTVDYGGKTLPGQSVRIQPYLDDPLHARFEPYVHKTYTFIISEQVPGMVYQLSTSLTGQGEGPGTAAAVAAKAVPGAAPATPATPATAATVAAAAAPATPPAPAITETLTLVRLDRPSP